MLTPQETEEIFTVLRRLAAGGHSIVFISHKLYEVLEIADRITVIRRGKVVGEPRPGRDRRGGPGRADGRPRGLAGGRPRRVAPGRGRPPGRRPDASRTTAATRSSTRVDLEVRAGEILGIAGVAGNGQDELVEALVGLRRPASGTVTPGRPGHHRPRRTRRVHEAGVAYVPGRPAPVRPGPVVPHRRQPGPDQLPPTAVQPGHPAQRQRHRAGPPKSASRPSTSGRRRPTARPRTLSGGNQQKVVVAREFERDLRCSSSTSRRAASTSGASNSSIARPSPSAMPARPSCSSRPSSTRCSSCPTASRSCTAGGSWRVVDGRTADKNEVGLLMATGGRNAAAAAVIATDMSADLAERPGRGERRLMRIVGRVWGILALPLISIVLAVIVGSLVDHPRRVAGRRDARARAGRRCLCGAGQRVAGQLQRHRQHAGVGHAAAPRRPVGRAGLQGRAVQHRRPGPVPDRRPVRGHRRRLAPGEPPIVGDPGVASWRA